MEPDPQDDAPRRVEAYLDQVLAPLNRRLSACHQQELRRELRAHLWGRIDAYQELGQSENDAVTEALQQFGGARDFTRQWRREWTKVPAISASTLGIWEAGKAAFKPALGGVAAAFLPFVGINLFYQRFQHSSADAFLLHYGGALYLSWLGIACLLLPVLVGMRQGRRQPKHAGAGMATVLVSGIAAVSLLYEVVVDGMTPDGLYVGSLCSVLLMLMVIWLPIAGGSAALTGWWTQRRKRALA